MTHNTGCDTKAAFFDAVRQGDLRTLESLLERDASLANARAPGDATLLNGLIWSDKRPVSIEPGDSRDATPLHFAAFHGHVQLAKLLIAYGADVNAVGYENNHEMTTPVVLAAWEGGLDILRLLLEHGADPNAHSSNGVTPLSTAIRHGKHDRVALLQAHGATE